MPDPQQERAWRQRNSEVPANSDSMAKRTLALYLLKPEVGQVEDALSGSTSGAYGVSS